MYIPTLCWFGALCGQFFFEAMCGLVCNWVCSICLPYVLFSLYLHIFFYFLFPCNAGLESAFWFCSR